MWVQDPMGFANTNPPNPPEFTEDMFYRPEDDSEDQDFDNPDLDQESDDGLDDEEVDGEIDQAELERVIRQEQFENESYWEYSPKAVDQQLWSDEVITFFDSQAFSEAAEKVLENHLEIQAKMESREERILLAGHLERLAQQFSKKKVTLI